MKDRTLLLGMITFILLEYVPKDVVEGKRLRKKIVRSIKKRIKTIEKLITIDKYNEIFYCIEDIIGEAQKRMDLDRYKGQGYMPLNPGIVLLAAEKRLPGFLDNFNLLEAEINEYNDEFEHYSLTLTTTMFVKRLFDVIDELEIIKDVDIIK